MTLGVRKLSDGLQVAPDPKKPVQIVSLYIGANGDFRDTLSYMSDGRYMLAQVQEVHAVAGTDAGAVNVMLEKWSGPTSPYTQVNMLASAINLKAAANTVQTATLTSTIIDRVLEDGDRIEVDFTGTLTSLAGMVITFVLIPLITNAYYRSPQA